MSNLRRLERIVTSWTGKLTRQRKYYYSISDARLVLTELGMEIPPDIFAWITDDHVALEEFVSQLHESEESLGFAILEDQAAIHANLDPKVYIEWDRIIFSINLKGKEKIFAEIELPESLKKEKPAEKEPEIKANTPPKSDSNPGGTQINID